MNALDKNVAVLRGEAMAANLLSSVAVQLLLMNVPNKEETLAGMTAFIDDTLNRARPGSGDPDDEFNTQIREVARFQAMQFLDHLKMIISNLPNPPASG
jgi:hypothetical protein